VLASRHSHFRSIATLHLYTYRTSKPAAAFHLQQAGAGNALCDLLSARAAAAAAAAAAADPSSSAAASAAAAADSQLALEGQLLEELLVRAPDAQWARARLAGLQLQLRQYEPAVSSYQAAIRSSPKSAELWEGLAAAYQALGRHASALKSYGRALELNPDRPYCLMSAGALDYMNGAYISAAERYRAALQLVPQHPAALLGLAEVLLSSAGQHVAMGAVGAAAVELSEAADLATAAVTGVKMGPAVTPAGTTGDTAEQAGAGPAPAASAAAAAVALLTPSPGRPAVGSPAAARSSSSTAGGAAGGTAAAAVPGSTGEQPAVQFQYSTNSATAWKLLGDVLLQQHMLQPTAAATAMGGSQDADAAVAAALQGLAARQCLLAKARRAYAHALMLNPTVGEVWGDVAQCYSHQARLQLELQPPKPVATAATAGAQAPVGDAVTAARTAAVRMARGGLRLAPANSWLWGVLAHAAAAAGDAAAAEYGYSRALSLDPKAAMLWVQLGRLYSSYGSGEENAGCSWQSPCVFEIERKGGCCGNAVLCVALPKGGEVQVIAKDQFAGNTGFCSVAACCSIASCSWSLWLT
jgi:tetratricopeptide (TPR) repeat protein